MSKDDIQILKELDRWIIKLGNFHTIQGRTDIPREHMQTEMQIYTTYLGAQTVLVPLITREAIRHKKLALPQYPDTLLSCVRHQIPGPHHLSDSKQGSQFVCLLISFRRKNNSNKTIQKAKCGNGT